MKFVHHHELARAMGLNPDHVMTCTAHAENGRTRVLVSFESHSESLPWLARSDLIPASVIESMIGQATGKPQQPEPPARSVKRIINSTR